MEVTQLQCVILPPNDSSQLASIYQTERPARFSQTSSAPLAALPTVCPAPEGPASFRTSTCRVWLFPTSSTVPPTYSSFSTRASIASATSSGSTQTSLTVSIHRSFSGFSVHSGVLMTPGATPLTRILGRSGRGGFSRSARERMKLEMPLLAAT